MSRRKDLDSSNFDEILDLSGSLDIVDRNGLEESSNLEGDIGDSDKRLKKKHHILLQADSGTDFHKSDLNQSHNDSYSHQPDHDHRLNECLDK